MLQLSRLLLGGLAITLLSACGYEHTVIGKIEDDLLITKEEIHEMGYEEFKKQYLGKIVSISDLEAIGVGGGYSPKNGQCNLAYRNNAEMLNGRWHNPHKIAVFVYTNKTPENALKKIFIESSYNQSSLNYANEIELPKSICDKCTEWDKDLKSCISKSPHTIITGKIIQVGFEENINSISIGIRLSGLAY